MVTIMMNKMRPSRWLQTLLLLSLWVARASTFHSQGQILALCNNARTQRGPLMATPWSISILLRGGSTEEDQFDQSEEEDYEEEEDEDKEKEETEESPLESVISNEPLTVTIKTNLGNPIVDTSTELLVSRTRNVESVKQTLARQLPGRPPVSALTLMSGTRVLSDDELIDELVNDVEGDDDDDDECNAFVLTLDMVPPVDPKFATEFGKLHEMTTSDLLDAYAANAAAMYHNAQSLVSESSADKAFGSLSIQLRHEAYRIRDQLTSSFPESILEKLMDTTPPSQREHTHSLEPQRRGQRNRSGRGGAKTNIKRMVQRNLNANWSDTIRNFLLFIFFGLFGGRNTVSKNLLLLGAPLCFVLQARPVKIMLKQVFYAMSHPPGIFLSLLPAPQQAILSFREDDAMVELYGAQSDTVEMGTTDNDEDENEDLDDYRYEEDYDDDESY